MAHIACDVFDGKLMIKDGILEPCCLDLLTSVEFSLSVYIQHYSNRRPELRIALKRFNAIVSFCPFCGAKLEVI